MSWISLLQGNGLRPQLAVEHCGCWCQIGLISSQGAGHQGPCLPLHKCPVHMLCASPSTGRRVARF